VPVGHPEVSVIVGNNYAGGVLFQPAIIDVKLDLLECFFVEIELKNKIYTQDHETAVKIDLLQIDGVDLVPRFDYLATYINDHNNNNPTSYLGFNGKWTLTFGRPFYQWLHQATGQGWLLG
jgi:hypothetical protein